ncbi:ATPase, T2SS/T4P/T4SS family [Pseudanabaena sp. PCC 6802]|uniref:GspE/PulE family protein n=1 Tax=Pseudanabaena sp. PCC 6802 TaxID=118173 RepID=UPI00034784DE
MATSDQFSRAIEESAKQDISILEALEQIIGHELAPKITRYFKKMYLFELSLLYGIEAIDPEVDQEKFDVSGISRLIDSSVIPINKCKEHEILPLIRTDSSLLVGMVNPDNMKALDELNNQILRSQGLALQKRVIARQDCHQVLYEDIVNLQVKQSINQAEDIDQEHLEIDTQIYGADESLDAIADEDDDLGKAVGENSAPIIKLVDQILVRALKDGVSDIHIEPQEKYLRVRFRKDGVLREMVSDEAKKLPRQIIAAVTSRFKIIANLDIAERRKPQDGKLKRNFQGRRVDFRVNTLPTPYGEKIVLRILDNSTTQLGLDKLITDPDSLKLMQDMARRPFGLILVTGPTGSGKTTTLYSTLAECNDPGINISTAEDPIEYSLPGLTQCQVIREKGMDFANILRAFLRQDPDVILVGETRDKETAKTAIEAALTGHLVLTTLHTNDAPSAIARLEEMGIEPFMTSTALIGVLAQRLLRRVCSGCRIPYNPNTEELDSFGLPHSDRSHTFYRANTLSREEILARQSTNKKICPVCGGVGYKGRVGAYEIMRMSERLQSAINKGASTDIIKEIAVEEGMKTLMAYSFDLVRQGYTTLEEVLRVTYTDKGREAEERARRKRSLECQTCNAILRPEMLECPYCTTPRIV